jgi:hypothetical protein
MRVALVQFQYHMTAIVCKDDLQRALINGGLQDIATIRTRMRSLPTGQHKIQSVGASPSSMRPKLLYLCTTDGHIWLIDDINADYVHNMVSLAHGAGIKPFPCVGVCAGDGRILIDDLAHVDADREQRMRSDIEFDAAVVTEWLRGTSADPTQSGGGVRMGAQRTQNTRRNRRR